MEFSTKQLTIVLLDLIGSTAFVQRAGPQRAAEWLQYHDRLARSLLYRFDGREIDRSDGFLLSFNRTIDAVNWALTYQATIPKKTKLNARIGIHFGTVVEVQQDELTTMAGAKRVELEGISKNIAARVMSLCGPGQVLCTADAMRRIKGRTNKQTPQGTRYACAGLYKFKGVRDAMVVYTIGATIQSLQPPPGSEKVKRIGGPKKIKSRARDRKILEWVVWAIFRAAFLASCYILYLLGPFLLSRAGRHLWGIYWLDWLDYIQDFVQWIMKQLN